MYRICSCLGSSCFVFTLCAHAAVGLSTYVNVRFVVSPEFRFVWLLLITWKMCFNIGHSKLGVSIFLGFFCRVYFIVTSASLCSQRDTRFFEDFDPSVRRCRRRLFILNNYKSAYKFSFSRLPVVDCNARPQQQLSLPKPSPHFPSLVYLFLILTECWVFFYCLCTLEGF